jgi:hypothetical protein
MLISTALLLDSNIRNSVCTPAKLPCRRVEVGYEILTRRKEILLLGSVRESIMTPSRTSFHKQNLALLGYYVSGSPCLLCVPEVGLLYLLQLRTPNLSSGPKIKLKGIKLRDREGHRIGPLRPIQRFGYLRFK